MLGSSCPDHRSSGDDWHIHVYLDYPGNLSSFSIGSVVSRIFFSRRFGSILELRFMDLLDPGNLNARSSWCVSLRSHQLWSSWDLCYLRQLLAAPYVALLVFLLSTLKQPVIYGWLYDTVIIYWCLKFDRIDCGYSGKVLLLVGYWDCVSLLVLVLHRSHLAKSYTILLTGLSPCMQPCLSSWLLLSFVMVLPQSLVL